MKRRIDHVNLLSDQIKPRNFLVAILIVQSAACALVFFDVPVARQIFGFIYFTFVPGFVLVKLLRMDELSAVESLLFSVGLSVAFLMLSGLAANYLFLSLDIPNPLSPLPLMIIVNSFLLAGGIIFYLRGENVRLWKVKTSEIPYAGLLLLVIPVLTVLGTTWVNLYDVNSVLLIVIIIIALLLGVGVVSERLLPSKLYPLAILVIAVSLLFHSSLISNYLVTFASDVPLEYYVFRTTANNALWSSTNPFLTGELFGRLNDMLSITVLPAIYVSLLKIDAELMFKVLYPLIFSFVPLGLYNLWQTKIGKRYAFVASFLFMAQATFFTEMLGLNRQMVAELFFVLLLLVIFNDELKPLGKTVLFLVFSFALVTSHYALAEIFLFFVSFAFLAMFILKRRSRRITVSMIVLFLVLMFTWYIFTSGSAAFDSLLSFGDYVYGRLGEFSDISSRGGDVMRGLGMEAAPSIWSQISRIFAYLTEALIGIGFIGLVFKRTRTRLENEYFWLSLVAMVLLGALVLVPGLATSFRMTRFYHVLLFFLAPFCVIGASVIIRLAFRQERELAVSFLLLIVLLPYFLFQTGVVYEVTGSDVWSLSLSKYRMSLPKMEGYLGYIDEYSVFGARWLSGNIDAENRHVYADISTKRDVLTIYGMIYRDYIEPITNGTRIASGRTIYLGQQNVVGEKILGIYNYTYVEWSYSELRAPLNDLNKVNKVYSNGGSEVYIDPGI